MKTRAGGDFSRQSGKHKFKFGQGLSAKAVKLLDDKQKKSLQETDSGKIDSSSNTNKKSKLHKRKGIADKIANKLGGSESSFQEFTSQDEKREDYGVVENEVHFGSDNDNHWTE